MYTTRPQALSLQAKERMLGNYICVCDSINNTCTCSKVTTYFNVSLSLSLSLPVSRPWQDQNKGRRGARSKEALEPDSFKCGVGCDKKMSKLNKLKNLKNEKQRILRDMRAALPAMSPRFFSFSVFQLFFSFLVFLGICLE